MKRILSSFIFFLCLHSAIAQTISGKVVDAATGESIPYAGIQLSDAQHLISNADGLFTLSEANSKDNSVIVVSYLGYQSRQMTVAEMKKNNNTVALQPGIIELENVTVKKPDPYAIMAEVRKNLKKNYINETQTIKEKIFYRQSNAMRPKKFDVEIDKSTGYNKNALKKINDEVKQFTSAIVSSPPISYTDLLCDYYSAYGKKEGKSNLKTKMDVVKATKLRDENRSASVEEMQKKGTEIFLKHMDTTKYYRIKSGWFGSRDTISFRKDFNDKKKKKEKRSNVSSAKNDLNSFLVQSNVIHNEKFTFVNQPQLYEYKYEGALYSSENEFIYVLAFKPKKSKAKYVGKLYISETDYAVVRADYQLDEGEREGGINLKLLLGVKVFNNVNSGTLIYKKSASADNYRLRYASIEEGNYMYINRPVKFIELTEGEKDVFAFDIKIEGNTFEKTELLAISDAEISEEDFEKTKEDDFTYTRLKRYDPKIWKDQVSIEPLEEMKQFKVVE